MERQRLRWAALDAVAQAAQQAGIPASADFNRGDNEGVGRFEVNQRCGGRWNAAKTFLWPACAGESELQTGANLTRMLLERDGDGTPRAVGIEVRLGGGAPVEVRAARQVVLASGAVGTPALL